MKTEIYNVDYNDYVSLVGTAHFTKRSLQDAYRAVEQLKPTDLAIELDMRRFRILSSAPWSWAGFGNYRKCEFIGATEALGNVDANIWLIDMSEEEIRHRIQQLTTPFWTLHISLPYLSREDEETRLWEQGYKDEVINAYKRKLDMLRRRAPATWQVLIDERNTIMAARLAWIASEHLKEDKKPNILTFVGAAHIEGMKKLLNKPLTIKENLRRLGLAFTPPPLVRRISVNAD